MESYEFNEITIKQITLTADVSRQTFYRHFNSKEEILIEYSKGICSELSARLNSLADYSLYNIANVYFSFWKEKSDLLIKLKKSKCEFLLMSFYNRIMRDSLNILRPAMAEYSDEDFEKLKAFLIGGFYNIKIDWMNRGFNEAPEKLAELIDKTFSSS